MPVLLGPLGPPEVADIAMYQELWGLDIIRLARLDTTGAVFLYLKAGEQSCDTTVMLNKELNRAAEQVGQ